MDVYFEVEDPDPKKLINSPLSGRYCGSIPPRQRVSLGKSIALAFFSDKNLTEPILFAGEYNFIPDSE